MSAFAESFVVADAPVPLVKFFTPADGDIITFAGDTNQYVVASGDSDVLNAGTITLQNPGRRQAIRASATAITVVGNSARNMFFARSALALATRAPAAAQGDMAADRIIITDPLSGLSRRALFLRAVSPDPVRDRSGLGLRSDQEGPHRSGAWLTGLNTGRGFDPGLILVC
ncbi:hypothetical protein HGP14_23415 [Rhizobium sp. P32RR-XVIII]|uniref:hypothetical protein n=1 Tax=Rhizobium sp. P32RR-XVIII TaxID=2726738 RepID=UPI0014566CE4|nr:hypothetical protein [Rhizobium sp. P32RR-XVIII]NLS06275.1 hypothetical protein [Rhizobium sp. P32RR-XVIII]